MVIIDGLKNWTMEKPQMFGGFHLFFLFLALFVTTLLIHFFKNSSFKTVRTIILISWIILVFFEVGKQLMYSYNNGVWKYTWSQFPFQFCETPMYVLPFLFFIKNERIRNALIHFFATFAFFAGLALLVLPLTTFDTNVFLNIRTMIQHGIQVILGLYLFAWNRKNVSLKGFLEGSYIFLGLLTIAVILNFTLGKHVERLNLFFVSKEYDSIILIIKDLKPHVPWFVFLLSYILGFYFCALASYFVEYESYRLSLKFELKEEKEVELKN